MYGICCTEARGCSYCTACHLCSALRCNIATGYNVHCTPCRDDHLGSTELTAKLEPAFLSGLRCPVVQIRSKFFAIFDSSVQKRLFDRLLYIVCSQNWEQCVGYFWIKHCLEVGCAIILVHVL